MILIFLLSLYYVPEFSMGSMCSFTRKYKHFSKTNARMGLCPDNDYAEVGKRCTAENLYLETYKD